MKRGVGGFTLAAVRCLSVSVSLGLAIPVALGLATWSMPARAVVALGNADARKVLEDEHAQQSIFHLQVGRMAVVGKDAAYRGADATGERRFNELRAWSHVGLVSIKADPDWVTFEQGRGDRELHNQKKEGVIRRIIVEATPKAKEFRDPKVAGQYNIPMGNLVIDRIEENIARVFGADEYRVITFSGRIDFLPVTAEYFTQFFARKITQEGRAIYLMKFEPATRSWTRIAADWADEKGSFKSSNVQRKLLELGKN